MLLSDIFVLNTVSVLVFFSVRQKQLLFYCLLVLLIIVFVPIFILFQKHIPFVLYSIYINNFNSYFCFLLAALNLHTK